MEATTTLIKYLQLCEMIDAFNLLLGAVPKIFRVPYQLWGYPRRGQNHVKKWRAY